MWSSLKQIGGCSLSMHLVNPFFFFFNILMGSWWEKVIQGVGYGKVFHCYIEKEQFRKNGYDVIYMKICTFEIYKKNRTNTS